MSCNWNFHFCNFPREAYKYDNIYQLINLKPIKQFVLHTYDHACFIKTWFALCTDSYNPDFCLLYLSWRWTIRVTVKWRFFSPELVLQTKRPCRLRNKGLNRANLLRIDRHRNRWPVTLDLETPEDTVNAFLEALDIVIQTRVFSTCMTNDCLKNH